MIWSLEGEIPNEDEDDLFDCPFCEAENLVWEDACRFGCTACGATFSEEIQDAIEFIPAE